MPFRCGLTAERVAIDNVENSIKPEIYLGNLRDFHVDVHGQFPLAA